ncbi:MAG: histidine phosphatase family protein [Clostridia bacterium]|nr:histidine phosphatase family protein [Clostridia bacterium]
MNLILIRHGKTEANERHLYCGATDLPLSERGKAELLEQKQTMKYPDVTGMCVLTSGMRRCEETLCLLYGNVPHDTVTAFREMDFGAFEMRAYSEMKDDPDYIAWITGDNEANVTPGGESGKIMTARVLAALDDLIADAKDTLLVTHGGVIAAIMAHLFPGEGKNRYEWQPKPGGGYVIELTVGNYHCL